MIKTLIFDFGDVFINLDKPAVNRELRNYGIPEITSDMLEISHLYEAGKISTKQILTYFKEKYHVKETHFIKAWNSIILDFPEYRLEFLEELKENNNFNLILLSNTNDLHIEYVIETMGVERYNRFKNCFDQFYLSHEIKYRKPNKDIFEFVLTQNNLDPKECLFVDDTKENTTTASNIGIHTWNNDPLKEDIVNLFTIKTHLF